MNYKSFDLGDWIGHISGVIEDETTLDGNEMRDLVEFLSTIEQEPTATLDKIRERIELEKLGYPPSAGYYKAIMKCLQIIDKYTAESEDKE